MVQFFCLIVYNGLPRLSEQAECSKLTVCRIVNSATRTSHSKSVKISTGLKNREIYGKFTASIHSHIVFKKTSH